MTQVGFLFYDEGKSKAEGGWRNRNRTLQQNFSSLTEGSFSRPKLFLKRGRRCMRAQLVSCVPVFVTTRPLQLRNPPGSSVHGISQAGYWSGLPFPPPGDLLDPTSGFWTQNPRLLHLLLWQAEFLTASAAWEAQTNITFEATFDPSAFPHKECVASFSLSTILYLCVCAQSLRSDSLWPHGLWSSRFLCPWDFPGRYAAVGC